VIRHEGQVANILMYDGANGRPIFSIDSPDM
jgi:prepilin-type processing-associated H-X9-DG protein